MPRIKKENAFEALSKINEYLASKALAPLPMFGGHDEAMVQVVLEAFGAGEWTEADYALSIKEGWYVKHDEDDEDAKPHIEYWGEGEDYQGFDGDGGEEFFTSNVEAKAYVIGLARFHDHPLAKKAIRLCGLESRLASDSEEETDEEEEGESRWG